MEKNCKTCKHLPRHSQSVSLVCDNCLWDGDRINYEPADTPPAEKVERFEKVDEWISVEDRLPENNEEILIWSKSEAEKAKRCGRDLKPMAVYYFDGFKHYGIRQEQEWLDSINITHWMPLPKPPAAS